MANFQRIWLLGFAIHLLIFTFILDIYFTSPIKHGMTPHKVSGRPLAKRIVVFIADGLRAEAIYPKSKRKRVEYLTDLRFHQDSAWGVVHTGVPTETRPGHVAIFGGLYEDPSALFTGWQANIVEFDSIINESNYAWSYGSPDIVKIFTKHNKYKLHIEFYDQEDFSGRTSTIHLDTWVFNRVKELLTPRGNSCQAQRIRRRYQKREFDNAHQNLENQQMQCTQMIETCPGEDVDCQERAQKCLYNANALKVDLSIKQINMDINTMKVDPVCVEDTASPLYESGNVFFLHLLGMDTAGHVHKPDSQEYLENLKAIDAGVKQTEQLFRDYFNDDETVFLFTSDHGMTDWGSHGDGTEHETDVPCILWGKGVRANRVRFDLNQVDLAPLIASLIGIPIPMNSVGVLPHQILNGSDRQIVEAVRANVRQLLEQYYCLMDEFKRDPLFVEFREVKRVQKNFEQIFQSMESVGYNLREQVEHVVILGQETMAHILEANHYMRYYYFKPKLACVILGFCLWMGYLQLSIHQLSNITEETDRRKLTPYKRLLGLFMVLICVLMTVVNANMFSYLYPLFPLGVLYLYVKDHAIVNQLLFVRREFLCQIGKYGILVQLLVIGFFHRICCALVVIILALWLTQNRQSLNTKAKWFSICSMLALLQIFEPSTKFKFFGLTCGSIAWIGMYTKFLLPMDNAYMQYYDIKYKSTIRKIIMAPLLIYILAAMNIAYVAADSPLGYLDVCLCVSWILLSLVLMLIPMVPKGIVMRFLHIAACLIVPYTLMAINIDLIFFTILILTLYFWMCIETAEADAKNVLNHEHFLIDYIPQKQQILSTQYRYTYFYLALTICYFFAIGNVASFNGFDPLWTRAFVATFNPILMTTLIIFKMIIPFFLITCAFYAIVLLSKQNYTSVFMILLLFVDQMVLNFMLFVRNEGSWKDIGKSLSHFALMEAMGLVMLVFFVCAKFVCTFSIGEEQIYNLPVDKPCDREIDEENCKQINVNIEPVRKSHFHHPQQESKRSSQVKNTFWQYVNRFICKKRIFRRRCSKHSFGLTRPKNVVKQKMVDISLQTKGARRHLKKVSSKFSSSLLDNKVPEEKCNKNVKTKQTAALNTKMSAAEVVSKISLTCLHDKKHDNSRQCQNTASWTKPIYNFTYDDIFPTSDKMQENEVRTLYLKPSFLEDDDVISSSSDCQRSDEVMNSNRTFSKTCYTEIGKETRLRHVQSSTALFAPKMNENRKVASCSEIDKYASSKDTTPKDEIKFESYFDPSEIKPSGKRVFHTSRTSLNNPDVLKFASRLTLDEGSFRYMSDMQKKSHLRKLKDAKVKSPSQEVLLSKSKCRKKISNTSLTSSMSSIHSTDEVSEVLRKEVVRNEKKLRRRRRQMVKQRAKDSQLHEEERAKILASGDATRYSSDIPESFNFHGRCPSVEEYRDETLIAFRGVCTSLRRRVGCEYSKSKTCSQYLTNLNVSVSPIVIASTDLPKMPRDPNSPRHTPSNFDCTRSYPSFLEEGGTDPSVYLLKVENWLKRSEPVANMDQLLDFNITQYKRSDSKFIDDVPFISDMPNKKLIQKMARRMIEDRVLPCAGNINQVLDLVSYILKIAQELGGRESAGMTKTLDRATSGTQVASRKDQACNTMKIYQTHIGVQHLGYTSLFLGTITQGIQTCVDTVSRGTLTNETSPIITISIGIQNCFDSIGVGTESISERVSIGTQSTRESFSSNSNLKAVASTDDDIAIRESLSDIFHHTALSTISEVTLELSSEAREISPESADRGLRRREEKKPKLLTLLGSPEKPPAFVPPLVLPSRSCDSTIGSISDNILDSNSIHSGTHDAKKSTSSKALKNIEIPQVVTDSPPHRPIDELIHNFARREASKHSASPPRPQTEIQICYPKVRSAPRTDYSPTLLPEAESCLHPRSAPTSGRKARRRDISAPFTIPKHAKLGPLPKHEDVALGDGKSVVEAHKPDIGEAMRRLPQILQRVKKEKASPRKHEQVVEEK